MYSGVNDVCLILYIIIYYYGNKKNNKTRVQVGFFKERVSKTYRAGQLLLPPRIYTMVHSYENLLTARC